jgi:hypothetical protein
VTPDPLAHVGETITPEAGVGGDTIDAVEMISA